MTNRPFCANLKKMNKRLLVLCLVAPLLSIGAHAATPKPQSGYIPMPDGVMLRYTVDLPASSGRFPVALVYDGYSEGSDPIAIGNDYEAAPALRAAGYAVLGVSIRGTGCSSGSWYPVSRQWGQDGARVVEWAAAQTWSNGHVGMFGLSFPGLTQLAVAPFRPPHLDAIAPFQPTADYYRDVMYPGGIFNSGFMGFWGFGDQPGSSISAQTYDIRTHPSETGCEQSIAQQQPADTTQNVFVQGKQHPYFSDWWRNGSADAFVGRINVPVLTCLTWQDDEVGSRNGVEYLNRLDPKKTWVIAANGYHGQCEFSGRTPLFQLDERPTSTTATLVRFFDRFVKHQKNGFDTEVPHVQIWHEAHAGATADASDVPAWVTSYPSWPVAVKPVTLSLRAGGMLSTAGPAVGEPADSYAYPGPSASTEDGAVTGQNNALWKIPVPPGSSQGFTTPALANDVEVLGPASADLWVQSTASDTDLQVTINEIRPDGQEEYVARGWLRMSHRKLDARQSTRLRPYQTHTQQDAQLLTANTPTLGRVEVFPFNHVFRRGSHIRVLIEAPTGQTGGWSFDFLKTPGVNTILHDAAHPSRLVLGLIKGGTAHAPLPACDTISNQPCRTNVLPTPTGTLALS